MTWALFCSELFDGNYADDTISHSHKQTACRSTVVPYAISGALGTRRKWWTEALQTGEIKGFKQRHFKLHIWIFSITPRWREKGEEKEGGKIPLISHLESILGNLGRASLVNYGDEWGFRKKTQLMTRVVCACVWGCALSWKAHNLFKYITFHLQLNENKSVLSNRTTDISTKSQFKLI